MMIKGSLSFSSVLTFYWMNCINQSRFSIELPRITSGYTMFTAKIVGRSEGYYPFELSSGILSDRTDVCAFGVVLSNV